MEEVHHTLQKYGTKTLQLYKCVPSRSLSVCGDCLQGGVLYGYALIVLLRVCLVNVTTLHLSQTWPPHRHTLSPTSFLCHALFHLSSSSFLFPSGNISSLKWKLKYVPLRGYTYCIMLSHCCRVLCQVCSVVFGYISL